MREIICLIFAIAMFSSNVFATETPGTLDLDAKRNDGSIDNSTLGQPNTPGQGYYSLPGQVPVNPYPKKPETGTGTRIQKKPVDLSLTAGLPAQVVNFANNVAYYFNFPIPGNKTQNAKRAREALNDKIHKAFDTVFHSSRPSKWRREQLMSLSSDPISWEGEESALSKMKALRNLFQDLVNNFKRNIEMGVTPAFHNKMVAGIIAGEDLINTLNGHISVDNGRNPNRNSRNNFSDPGDIPWEIIDE